MSSLGQRHHDDNADGDHPSPQQSTVMIFTKAQVEYSLTVRADQVVLAPANVEDEHQDEEGNPGFALINNATGQALKHFSRQREPVLLVPYNPNYLDMTILWSESGNLGGVFDNIRVVNKIIFNFDAFHGDDYHGGVHDGTYLVVYKWFK